MLEIIRRINDIPSLLSLRKASKRFSILDDHLFCKTLAKIDNLDETIFKKGVANFSVFFKEIKKKKTDTITVFRKIAKECGLESGVDFEKLKKTNTTSLQTTFSTWIYKNKKEIDKIGRLDLSGLDLKYLPKEIDKLSSLKTLNLTHNQLTYVPKEIGNLSSLLFLDLGNNQLTSVPEEIGNLRSLKKLYLYKNQLTSLPEGICNLSSLESLYLRDNHLTSLPEEIGNLSNHIRFAKKTYLTAKALQLSKLNSSLRRYVLTGAFLGAAVLVKLVPKGYECYSKGSEFYPMLDETKNINENCLYGKLRSQIDNIVPSGCRVENITNSVYNHFLGNDQCGVNISMQCCTSPFFTTACAIVAGSVLGGFSGLFIGIFNKYLL